MEWVRIHPVVANWPGGASPATFHISADENGSAVVELAWDPQALSAPACYTSPLRYYSSGTAFSATYTDASGTNRNLNIPAQTIQLSGNRATWTIPQALWDGYVQESIKALRNPPQSTFARNLYYRVRATAPGASQARIWPADDVLSGPDACAAPHLGILPFSDTPSSQVMPDQAAVAGMGGVWSDILTGLWRALPEGDPSRQSLMRIFAHQAFGSADLNVRSSLLLLWLFAGKDSCPRLPQLLDRQAVTGSNQTISIISKADLRGGRSLVENLLALLDITPHPDLMAVTTKEQLLDHVICEILDPNGQTNQGAAGTCSPTSLQTLLITVNPAEYARLQIGLLSASGRATLANGDVAEVPVGVLKLANYASTAGQAFQVRTFSELAFQAAMLKYAQGDRFPALTGTPQNINQIFQATIAGGLAAEETKRALDGLFSRNFTTHYVSLPANPGNAGWTAAQRAIRDGLVSDLPAYQQQMLMAMFWSQPFNFGHIVMAVRRDSGRIFFKNPQYPGTQAAPGVTQGGNGTNPPRRFDEPTQSLESISEADLASWIKGYWVPNAVIL